MHLVLPAVPRALGCCNPSLCWDSWGAAVTPTLCWDSRGTERSGTLFVCSRSSAKRLSSRVWSEPSESGSASWLTTLCSEVGVFLWPLLPLTALPSQRATVVHTASWQRYCSPPALDLVRQYCLIVFPVPGGLDGEESACRVGDLGLIPGSGRSLGEGNGSPLQYACLEDAMDRGAW